MTLESRNMYRCIICGEPMIEGEVQIEKIPRDIERHSRTSDYRHLNSEDCHIGDGE